MFLLATKIGDAFGRLTVVGVVSAGVRGGKRILLCKCSCGKTCSVSEKLLTGGRKASCGCGRGKFSHGLRYTVEWTCWSNIKKRCYLKSRSDYKYYGGKGIRMDAKWRSDFAAFYASVGPRPSPNHTLDRHPNNDGNYEPGNVRWATRTEQTRNRRNTRYLEIDGEKVPVVVLAERSGLWPQTVLRRMKRGLAVEDCIRKWILR